MRKALVFGPPETATHLARALEREGWTPELAGEGPESGLPSAADPDAAARLQARLKDFADQGGQLIHPGTGEWSERPELVTQGQELGLHVLGPPARVLSLFANKLNLLSEAERLGIPHLLLSLEPFHTVREIEALVRDQKIRYPFILKAVHGIPGGGYLVVQEADDLHLKLPLWLERLRRSRGHAMLLAERYLDTARLLIQPFARAAGGELKFFPLIDASLQSRYRKVIEFCPAPSVEPAATALLVTYARKILESCNFLGVGTLEFLTDGERVFLVNGAARLNSTYPLWERVEGTSAVGWQLATLMGPAGNLAPPASAPAPEWASALALRIFAEDPVLELPQPGRVEEISTPTGPAEITLRVKAGDQVDPDGTGLLGLAWMGAENFEKLLPSARRTLSELWIAGSVQTNERYLSEVLAHPWVTEKIFHAGFLDEEFVPSLRPPEPIPQVMAAVCRLATDEDKPGDRWAVGDQWAKGAEPEIHWSTPPARKPPGGLSGALSQGRVLAYPTGRPPQDPDRWLIRLGAWVLTARRVRKKAASGKNVAEALRALVGGRIHSILFQAGARVPAHEPVLVVESLGEFVAQGLPAEIRILRWLHSAGDRVEAGEPLAEFELASGT